MLNKNTSKPIDRVKAEKEIDEYQSLRSEMKDLISEAIKFFPQPKQDKLNTFYKTKLNSFVFSREAVLRFFFPEGAIPAPAENSAEYLMVILGAHDEKISINDVTFEKGQPTVILTGVKEIKDANQQGRPATYKTIFTVDPAEEYPPANIINSLPPSNENDNELVHYISADGTWSQG